MNLGHPSANAAIPGEYRKTAERLFPKGGQKPDIKAASEFAKALGIGVEHQRLLSLDRNSADMRKFLENFQNNLDLLIKKTWVEKSDEARKIKLQDIIPPFMVSIEQGDFQRAIEESGVIFEELAYLFFGSQSNADDFIEYAFRIDAQMGLFWWYGGRLSSLKEFKDKNGLIDDKVLWAVMLLGLCYLTNF
jgi:hypothetical protein